MGGITKSLWGLITGATHNAAPLTTARVPLASQPGTPFQTQIEYATIAEVLAGGGAALDIGLRRASVSWTNAEIIALTNKTIAAGIPNKLIQPVAGVLFTDFALGGYTNIAANATVSIGAAGAILSMAFFNNAASNTTGVTDLLSPGAKDIWPIQGPWFYLHGAADLISGNVLARPTPFDGGDDWNPIGADLKLFFFNGGSGPFTGGNVANSMRLEMLYWIV